MIFVLLVFEWCHDAKMTPDLCLRRDCVIKLPSDLHDTWFP
jgi:hypothetical protein